MTPVHPPRARRPAPALPYALDAAIRNGWSAATSADPHWSPLLPPAGQCAVTALVVQDHLGGTLLRATIAARSHYWNRIGGADIDLTRSQFANFDPDAPPQPRSRSQVLSFPDTARRYAALSQAVAAQLGEDCRALAG